MRFGNRYLPYPTFNEHGELNCYLRGYFRFHAFPVQDAEGGNLILKDVRYETNSPLLKRLVSEGRAGVLMVIECQDTVTRISMPISEAPMDFPLPISRFSGKIEISAFAYVTSAMVLSSNEEFSPEFQGQEFVLEKNSFLAIADGFVTSCIRQDAMDDHVDSIFTISRTGEETGPYRVELRDGKIDIQVPKDIFELYAKMRFGNTKQYFFSILLVPALSQALWLLKSECMKDESLAIDELYSNYRWLPSLSNAFKKAFNKELTTDLLRDEEDFTTIAQRLLGDPVCPGIKNYDDALIGAHAKED